MTLPKMAISAIYPMRTGEYERLYFWERLNMLHN